VKANAKAEKKAKDKAVDVKAIAAELDAKLLEAMKRVNDPVLKESRPRGWFDPGEVQD
jgi:hypothetical protein